MWTWALRWSVPASCHLGWRDGGLLWLLPYNLPSVLTHHTLESRCIMGNGLRWVTSFDRKVSSVHRYKLNCQLNRLTLILVLFSEYATWAKKKKRQLFVIFILLTKSRTAITNKCLNKQSLTNTEWIKIVQKIGEMEQFGLKRNKLVCDREYLKTQIFLFCYDCIIVSFCGETGDGILLVLPLSEESCLWIKPMRTLWIIFWLLPIVFAIADLLRHHCLPDFI